ncbi:murein biosynthesis integral membrane protein MurJ [Pacificimonas flava]|uniref:Probable lipid II flippase MurJ n=2 Tax=Pacificimonas TaxID=1960290 RepID=A0A219B223_9SPHN|nr:MULTISPECIES: murein biosynthesis integral membrane protein MurJ [Pacificimonas]MBZ6378108.1 murein biosynthesis integral membrane protein MurJ [Pacificimonas aurantium]OWV32254.1 murein biosynthesis integral membrane protein MurJ [Pacificimonas flava]
MSLIRNVGTIGGLTLVSRVFGFARDMLLARLLGAGTGADAFFVAFKLPNIFRRLFAEGAFSAAFVPMFSKELESGGGRDAAVRFSVQVLSVFLPILFFFTAIAEIFMPWIVDAMASAYREVPGKFELTVTLSRITFVYLLLISLVSLLAGILNSLSRFAEAAAAPVLLNICLITAVILFGSTGPDPDFTTARALAVAVSVAGILQFVWLLFAVRRAGIELKLLPPRMTPQVKRLLRIILPATFGAGIYQISQLVDVFFATRLQEGAMSFLNYADRLNQLPLGVIGIALGTAILPALSRLIGRDDAAGAQRLMSKALELSMMLTIPSAVGLMLCRDALTRAFFLGGRFDAADAAITADVMAGLAIGLPAYVLIKVFTPGYFARGDTKTPVYTALAALVVNIALILLLIERFDIVGLVLASAAAAWLNTLLLYAGLHRRGQYHLTGLVALRIGKQALAAALMAVPLWFLSGWLAPYFGGAPLDRVWSIATLIVPVIPVYFGALWIIGGLDPESISALRRRGSP